MGLLASLTVMSMLRWPATVHLLVIGLVDRGRHGGVPDPPTVVASLIPRARGRDVAVLHRPADRVPVDNGPLLPVWRELPHDLHWTLPTIIGVPLLVRALARHGQRALLPPARI